MCCTYRCKVKWMRAVEKRHQGRKIEKNCDRQGSSVTSRVVKTCPAPDESDSSSLSSPSSTVPRARVRLAFCVPSPPALQPHAELMGGKQQIKSAVSLTTDQQNGFHFSSATMFSSLHSSLRSFYLYSEVLGVNLGLSSPRPAAADVGSCGDAG